MNMSSVSTVCTLVVLALSARLLMFAAAQLKRQAVSRRHMLSWALLGVALNTVLPEGGGLASPVPGGVGFVKSVFAMAMGACLLLPLYALKLLRITDVMLMAMVGAYLGPNCALAVLLCSFVMAGVLAAYLICRTRSVGAFVNNIQELLMSGFFKMMVRDMPPIGGSPAPTPKLPFGVAIAAGTVLYLTMSPDLQILFMLRLGPA
ncbi:MAG: hypothetical protein JWP36_2483 [Paucimonas sp.]|nr:hypothetical protein [Paucimonas sp.]